MSVIEIKKNKTLKLNVPEANVEYGVNRAPLIVRKKLLKVGAFSQGTVTD